MRSKNPGQVEVMAEMKRYGLILADSPWRFRNAGITGAAEKHYPTMSTGEIMALPVPILAAPDSVLLLWGTWATVPDVLLVMGAWGFVYKTGFPWLKMRGEPMRNLWGEFEHKPVYGMGWWVRGCSEPVFVGVRGGARPPSRQFVGILSRRFKHSRKPENLYEYAEAFPGPRLEMFARCARPGWDAWGNEVEGSIDLRGNLCRDADEGRRVAGSREDA